MAKKKKEIDWEKVAEEIDLRKEPLLLFLRQIITKTIKYALKISLSVIAQAGASLSDPGTGAEFLSHILLLQNLSLGTKTAFPSLSCRLVKKEEDAKASGAL